ncbi:hypothetical protein BGZ76_008720 [Entomortierella beljakovae]|nr:hypothetical protein BGZ76_008720 [Entomortierella beljakovae]
MTTTNASEPETENTHSTGPLMERKASSPMLNVSSNPLPFTLPTTSTSEDSLHFSNPIETGSITTVNVSEVNEDSVDTKISESDSITSLDHASTSILSGSITSVSLATNNIFEASSTGKENAASYVLNGTHDGHSPIVPMTEIHSERSRRASHIQQLTQQQTQQQQSYKQQQQQQQQQQKKKRETKEMGMSIPVERENENNEHNNATSTQASNTPTTSLNLENSMSMTSPIRDTKSPPTSTSSSVSTERRKKIAESSMILTAGTIPSTSTAAIGGSLSPAWSMASIPRDISSAYSNACQDQKITIGDEKLYGLVDRYGFLVEEGRTPIAEKSVALQESVLSSSQRSVRAISESKIQTKVIEKEQERSLKWARMSKRFTSDAKETEYKFPTSSKFTKRVYKGIPDCWRAAAWSHLISVRSVGFEPNIRQIYHDMLDISSPEEEQIDLDIPRTMHGHIMFRTRYGHGQCALFNVLKAYSNYNNQVGYCQGMASIVATMLTFFDEEKTFILLAKLFEKYNINNLVVPGFPALFEAFYIQEELTKLYAPKVFEALETMGIATPSYASRWYITLYSAGVVPYRTLLRIWDILLLEGFDWLYFMAIALLKYHEAALVQNNFEQTMEMLNAKMDIQDDERLLRIALRLSKQAKRSGIVARLKKKYVASQKSTATVS